MIKTLKMIRAIKNRIIFGIYRNKFSNVGKGTLIESPFVVNGEPYISLGAYIRIKPRVQLEAIEKNNEKNYHPRITIGDYTSINYDVHIASSNEIIIGKNVLIASKVFITDHFHGNTAADDLKIPPSSRNLYSKGPVIIEDNVWIGEGCAIMPGITIGRNCIIGANSVVTKNIPEYSVAVGAPAKIIK